MESKHLLITILVIIGFISIVDSQTPACPNGWIAYKDEKCFRLMRETFVNQSTAELYCSTSDPDDPVQTPTLATIKSRPEQVWLTELIFTHLEVTSSVWFGVKRAPNTNATDFLWNDGSDVKFSNWAVGSPTNEWGRDCVELVSRISRAEDGQWKDVSCGDGNWFVCQKLQMWSLPQMQKAMLDMRLNPVPIGFLYTHLPGQPSPQELWPFVEWEDVTGNYSGQFFRAEGGGSAPFGEVQGGNSPRITKITHTAWALHETGYLDELTIVEGVNEPLHVGTHSTPTVDARELLTLEATGGEVRPINTAVRIWRRYN